MLFATVQAYRRICAAEIGATVRRCLTVFIGGAEAQFLLNLFLGKFIFDYVLWFCYWWCDYCSLLLLLFWIFLDLLLFIWILNFFDFIYRLSRLRLLQILLLLFVFSRYTCLFWSIDILNGTLLCFLWWSLSDLFLLLFFDILFFFGIDILSLHLYISLDLLIHLSLLISCLLYTKFTFLVRSIVLYN